MRKGEFLGGMRSTKNKNTKSYFFSSSRELLRGRKRIGNWHIVRCPSRRTDLPVECLCSFIAVGRGGGGGGGWHLRKKKRKEGVVDWPPPSSSSSSQLRIARMRERNISFFSFSFCAEGSQKKYNRRKIVQKAIKVSLLQSHP